VVLFTGLPSSGKTTLAHATAAHLRDVGIEAAVLDGDELRAGLPPAVGFDRQSRHWQLERAGFIAEILAGHGVIPLLAIIAPYAEDRERLASRMQGDYVEIHLAPGLAVCERRDSNGVYARARAEGGDRQVHRDIVEPYEAPVSPTLRLDTAVDSVQACVERCVDVVVATAGRG
jgi:adenylylsulfate kinase